MGTAPQDLFARRRGRRRRSRWVVLILVGVLTAVAAAAGSLRIGRVIFAQTSYQRVESHADAILFAARESGIDPHLLAAIMYVESRGRPSAVSHKNALGLFQLMLPTAQERARLMRLPEPSREDLLEDPMLNARLAAHYLTWLERRYESHMEKMLIAYNAGPGRLDRWIREAGGYAEWRAERDSAGDSDVLRYVRDVERHRLRFVARGHLLPTAETEPGPTR